MKKITFILLFFLISNNSFSHMGHYKNFNNIEMEILRNGEVIGYNFYFFKRDGNKTTVTNQIKFTVKLFGATVFEVEGYGEEKYNKEQLISYESKTRQNKKNKFVDLKYDNQSNKFKVNGSSYTGLANNDNIIGNWWSHKILQASSQISPISGSIKEQVVTFLGKETIILYGKSYEVEHFKLQSKDMSIPEDKRLDFDIWYDKENSIIRKVTYSRMGEWEYRVKEFN
jgi:hypothetical protein